MSHDDLLMTKPLLHVQNVRSITPAQPVELGVCYGYIMGAMSAGDESDWSDCTKTKFKNVIFDEAHNLCRTMRREGMKYYPEVMARHHPDLEVMRDGSVVRRAPRR